MVVLLNKSGGFLQVCARVRYGRERTPLPPQHIDIISIYANFPYRIHVCTHVLNLVGWRPHSTKREIKSVY